MRAADLLLQAGGFGVVALDLIDASPQALARIPPTAWFRFRRAIEPTPTVFLVLADKSLTKSCAAKRVSLERKKPVFAGLGALVSQGQRGQRMYVCIHAPDAGALARSFSPWVEMVDESTAVFSATKRQVATIPPNIPIAVASTIEAAILAARNFPGQTFLQPGEESRVLGTLSIDCLPPDPEIFQTLDLWGVRSLGDLAKLPEDGLAGRLGSRGLWLQKLARGALDRPLRPAPIETVYEESAEFDHPIELREPLLFIIGRFLFDLAAKLRAQSLAAGALILTLNKQERSLKLPFPTRDVKFLLKLTEHSFD